MKRYRPSVEYSTAVAAALVIAAANAFVHGWFLRRCAMPVGFDDGHVAASAVRLIQNHWLPYVDAIDHRGPLLYWYVALTQKMFGVYSWVGVRANTLLSALLATASCFFAGSAAKRPLAGTIAAGVFSYTCVYGMPPGAGLSLGGEHVAVPLAVSAVGLVALAVNFAQTERRRGLYLLAAGACGCLAMLAKQTSALLILPLIVWVSAWAFADEELPVKLALLRLAKLLAGWAGTLSLVLVPYAAHRALHTFLYWFFTYNRDVYMAPYRDWDKSSTVLAWMQEQPITVLAIALPLGIALLSPSFEVDSFKPRRLLAAYARAGFEVTSGSVGLLMMASALATMRFWPHYFIIVAPWVGMTVGLRAEQALHARPALGRKLGYVGVSLFIASLSWFGATRRVAGMVLEQQAGKWIPARQDAICVAIDHYTQPDDGLFVWGFDADLYISCARKPISKYVSSHFIAGIVPPFWDSPKSAYVARDSRAALAAEIRAQPPPLIVDDAGALSNFSMKRIPELARILRQDYCSLGPVTGRSARTVQLYLRNDYAECAGRP